MSGFQGFGKCLNPGVIWWLIGFASPFIILTEAQAWAIRSDPLGLSIKTVTQSLGPSQRHLSLMQKHINKVR